MLQSQGPKITDEHIAALRNGDRETLRWLFVQFQPRLYRFLWLKTKSVEASEDIVQETFLKLWTGRKELKSGTNLEIFLFRIASNLATDLLRKDERHRELEAGHSPPDDALQESEGVAEYNQLLEIIDKIVSNLPEAQRSAFLLSRYENLSHKEIAEVMNISIKTVEKHISKALQALKNKLEAFDIVFPS